MRREAKKWVSLFLLSARKESKTDPISRRSEKFFKEKPAHPNPISDVSYKAVFFKNSTYIGMSLLLCLSIFFILLIESDVHCTFPVR
jgi:hypothetical protein